MGPSGNLDSVDAVRVDVCDIERVCDLDSVDKRLGGGSGAERTRASSRDPAKPVQRPLVPGDRPGHCSPEHLIHSLQVLTLNVLTSDHADRRRNRLTLRRHQSPRDHHLLELTSGGLEHPIRGHLLPRPYGDGLTLLRVPDPAGRERVCPGRHIDQAVYSVFPRGRPPPGALEEYRDVGDRLAALRVRHPACYRPALGDVGCLLHERHLTGRRYEHVEARIQQYLCQRSSHGDPTCVQRHGSTHGHNGLAVHELEVGLPSDLLQQRADGRAVEIDRHPPPQYHGVARIHSPVGVRQYRKKPRA